MLDNYLFRLTFINILIYIFSPLISNAQYFSSITAEGFQKYNNEIVELHYSDYNENGSESKVHSALVKNGKFVFSAPLSNPSASGYLLFPKFKKQYLLVIDSGNLKLTLPNPEKINPNLSVTSETNKLFWNFINLNNKNFDFGKPTGNQTLRDIRLKELALAEKHKDNFYSLIKLADISFTIQSIKPEELKAVYEKIDTSLKYSKLGRWISKRLEGFNNTQIGKPLPFFTFWDENADVFTNAKMEKKPYLLAFTAYWCGPCKKQIPLLKELMTEYDNNGLEIIYINLDEDIQKWKKMIADYNLNAFINITDSVDMRQSVMAQKFFVNALPTNIVIDYDHKIRYNSAEILDLEMEKVRTYLDGIYSRRKD